MKFFKALLWHWQNAILEDIISAKRIIPAIEKMGIKVFPNTATCYHYDDKIAQKYLLEAIDAPLVNTYIFYNEDKALKWLQEANLRMVFKLSRGAGSANVRFVKTKKQAKILIKTAFNSGFARIPSFLNDASLNLRKHKKSADLLSVIKRLPNTLNHMFKYNKMIGKEAGYIYFQEFIPDNKFDTRITVIGNRAFAFRRFVRPNDFRASGSGNIDYNQKYISKDAIKNSFQNCGKAFSAESCF